PILYPQSCAILPPTHFQFAQWSVPTEKKTVPDHRSFFPDPVPEPLPAQLSPPGESLFQTSFPIRSAFDQNQMHQQNHGSEKVHPSSVEDPAPTEHRNHPSPMSQSPVLWGSHLLPSPSVPTPSLSPEKEFRNPLYPLLLPE